MYLGRVRVGDRRSLRQMDARRDTGNPTPDEVRTALDRVIASEVLRGSAQLIAFFRFVVEATLRSEGHRIKAYAIAVEALGRGEDFDPDVDPIVRVEAGRLWRTLERDYAGGGATDPLLIPIPRGRYVPGIWYRQTAMGARRESFAHIMLCLASLAVKFLSAPGLPGLIGGQVPRLQRM